MVGCEAHRELALQAARETITLLKNEGNLLPLDPARHQDHRGHRSECESQSAGRIQRRAEARRHGARRHSRAARQARKGALQRRLQDHHRRLLGRRTKSRPSDPEEDRKQIAEAVKVAKRRRCDRAGASAATSRPRAKPGRPSTWATVRASTWWAARKNCVNAMLATGKPVVVLLFNGRPLSINYVSQNVPAIFECWYLGQETGHAVAEVLFGDFNPGRQTADHDSALGRPFAGVLQSQALGAPRLSVRRRFAAVRLRLRT